VFTERFDILLALANEYDWRFQDLPKAVKHLSWRFAVYPPTSAVRPPLKEPFGFGTHDLIQEIAGFIGVVIFSDDPATLRRLWFGPEATSSECGYDRSLFASRIAVDEDRPIGVP